MRLRITPGQASDIAAAPDLLEGQQAGAVLADKACDGNALRTDRGHERPGGDPRQAQPQDPHPA